MPASDLPCPVLIVCDDAEARKRTVDALAKHECAAIEAHDADAALNILHWRRQIRGLVIAARQPGSLSGYDLARIVARDRPEIRHIVIIGSTMPGAAELPPGVYFLPRPLDTDLLIAGLRQGPRNLRRQ